MAATIKIRQECSLNIWARFNLNLYKYRTVSIDRLNKYSQYTTFFAQIINKFYIQYNEKQAKMYAFKFFFIIYTGMQVQ